MYLSPIAIGPNANRPESAGSIVRCSHFLLVDVGPGHLNLRMPLRVVHPAAVPAHLPPDSPVPYTTLFRPPYQPGVLLLCEP
jgi:hypothetical protein